MSAGLSLADRVTRLEALVGIAPAAPGTPEAWPMRRTLVLREAARLWGLSVEQIIGRTRRHEFVVARAAIVLVLRLDAGMSYPKIAAILGGKDPASARNLYRLGVQEGIRSAEFLAKLEMLSQRFRAANRPAAA